MKLTYLGTAAAEGWPALFCRCEYCMKALERGGKNLRTRSQAMVNDDLLIDFPADSFSHMQQNGLDFSAVKNLLITHSHMDHFSPSDLHLRSSSFYAHNQTSDSLTLYGNERVMKLLAGERVVRDEEPNDTGITAVQIEIGEESAVIASCSFNQAGEDMTSALESADYAILGRHNPVYKKAFSPDLSEAKAVLVSDNAVSWISEETLGSIAEDALTFSPESFRMKVSPLFGVSTEVRSGETAS